MLCYPACSKKARKALVESIAGNELSSLYSHMHPSTHRECTTVTAVQCNLVKAGENGHNANVKGTAQSLRSPIFSYQQS